MTEMLDSQLLRPRRRFLGLLALWAGGSMIIALLLFIILPSFPTIDQRRLAQAAGAQFLFWGLLSGSFALFGLSQLRAGRSTGQRLRDRDDLLRLLRFAVGLNAAMAAIGAGLIAFGWFRVNAAVIGHGLGVLLQSVGLLVMERQALSRIGATLDAQAASR